jgi:hypothetical protein
MIPLFPLLHLETPWLDLLEAITPSEKYGRTSIKTSNQNANPLQHITKISFKIIIAQNYLCKIESTDY